MSLRKTILLLVFTATSIQLKAQIDKGFWLGGGSLSWYSGNTKPETQKRTLLMFSPKVGYFFIDNLAAGISGRWEAESLILTGPGINNKVRSTLLAVGPFARYYFLKSDKNVNVFTDASATFGAFSQKDGESTGINQYIFTGGTSFFFTTSSALELSFGYQTTKYKTTPGTAFNSTFFGLGFQVHLIKN